MAGGGAIRTWGRVARRLAGHVHRAARGLRGGSSAHATPVFFQNDHHECGVVCLRIVLAHHGAHVPVAELRKSCGTSRQGFRLDYLAKTARSYGLKATGVAADGSRLAKMPAPLIVLWNFNHLVVLEAMAGDTVYLNDPALGRRAIPRGEFDDAYSGVALIMTKGRDFRPVGRPSSMTRTLAQRLKGSRRPFVFVVLASLGLIVPGWLLPTFTRQFVDQYFTGHQQHWLGPLIVGMVLTLTMQGAFSYLQRNALLRLQTKLAMSWGAGFFWHLLRLPVGFFAERHAGDLSNRFKFVDRVASLVAGQLTIGLMNLISVVFYGLIMLEYNVGLACISFVTVAVGWLLLSRAVRRVGEASERWYVERGAFFGSALTMLTHKEQFKAGGCENALFEQLVGRHARVVDANQRQEWQRIVLRASISGLDALHTVLVLVYGSKLIMTGVFTMGTLVAYQILAVSFFAPVVAIIGLNMRLYEAKAMVGAMDEVLEHPLAEEFGAEAPQDANGRVPAEAAAERKPRGWSIRLENLGFSYNPFDAPVIQDVSLDVEPGTRVALVGPSGSGRTTLGQLMAGLYAPTQGRLLFDGRPRESIPHREFRSHVAMIEQSSLLFDTTLRNNLTLWDGTIPEQQMVAAAKAALIHDVIVGRDGGYDHMVAANGANFSSGEIQRLEIARALAHGPKVLILDESTSFLDALSESHILENIRRRGITSIFVAHRLNTVRNCERIIVMERGRIVEQGSHEQLVALDGCYRRLIDTW